MAENSRALVWRKSSFCGTASCVEIAFTDDEVLVRDSKESAGSHLGFDRSGWRVFVAGLRMGTIHPTG